MAVLIWFTVVLWIACPFVCYLIGGWKGRPGLGFAIGLVTALPGAVVSLILWPATMILIALVFALMFRIPSTDLAARQHDQRRYGRGEHVSQAFVWHDGPRQRGHHRHGGGRHVR